jgi:hypothetical protein
VIKWSHKNQVLAWGKNDHPSNDNTIGPDSTWIEDAPVWARIEYACAEIGRNPNHIVVGIGEWRAVVSPSYKE